MKKRIDNIIKQKRVAKDILIALKDGYTVSVYTSNDSILILKMEGYLLADMIYGVNSDQKRKDYKWFCNVKPAV